MADDRTFMIIGGGLAGARAAETLRAEGFAGRVVLVGAEPDLPYERPPLSKGVLVGDDPSGALAQPPGWWADHDVELRLATAATAIDTANHAVTLADGEQVGYDRLLLATGSEVRRLEVPGADLDGVRTLRTLPDAIALRERLTPGARVVVVGAGWIGLEVAAAARSRGAEVVVVEPQPTPLHAVVGAEVGATFADLHREHGVDLRTGQGVTAVLGSDGRATAVVTSAGAEVPADLVVVGVGIRPAVALARAAGLEVDDGVVTDAGLRTSAPDVFAVGDVASTPRAALGGRRLRVEHWANAYDGGPVAARAMLGHDVTYDVMPFFYSDQYDLGLEHAGHADPASDRLVVRGDLAGREYVACWLDADGRLRAGMNVNVWDVTDDLQALIRSGRPLDADRLADPQMPIVEALA